MILQTLKQVCSFTHVCSPNEVSSESGHLVEVNRTTCVSKVTHVPKGFAGLMSQSPILLTLVHICLQDQALISLKITIGGKDKRV